LFNARFECKSISLSISSTPNRSKKAAEDYFSFCSSILVDGAGTALTTRRYDITTNIRQMVICVDILLICEYAECMYVRVRVFEKVTKCQ
jgi:hypothetical protein